VLDTSFRLNRNYNFKAFVVRPRAFLSSPQYANVQYQTDYAKRREIAVDIFEGNKARDAFAELTRLYPQMRFIFIDNTMPFNYYPGEINPPEWENVIYADIPASEIKEAKAQGRIKWADDRSFDIISVAETFNGYVRDGLVRSIYKTPSCSIYEIIKR
jgi:hypothetical protein